MNHITLELSNDIDQERLLEAWTVTARDHEILRTCFHELGRHFVQVVLEDCPLSCDYINMPSSSTSTDCMCQIEPRIGAKLIAHIDSKPPIRLTFASSDEKARLMLDRFEGLIESLVRGEPAIVETKVHTETVLGSTDNPGEGDWSTKESLMRNLVGELVGLPSRDVPVDASFFALGLDSIIAI